VKLDDSSDGLNKKVRNAETDHVNYILVVGEQEMNGRSLAVRNYKTKEQSIEEIPSFIQRMLQETQDRAL
jgi:threonyl-tRNA synthetase